MTYFCRIGVLLLLTTWLSCSRNSDLSSDDKLSTQEGSEQNLRQNVRYERFASLVIPPLLDTAGGKLVLRARKGTHELVPGVPSRSMGYNGNFLGPTILLHDGRKAEIEIINELGEETTLHSHGALIPGEYDGGPQKLIRAGATWSLRFRVKQEAATLWYHPHRVGSTAEQVWQGLAGIYIVRDANEAALPLPRDYGKNDIPVIVQERMVDRNGKILPYKEIRGHMITMSGARGNSFLVNGQLRPRWKAPSGWVRLRLLNGSNASSYRFSFRSAKKSGLEFYQIASEQGLLPQARKMRHIDITAGGRKEVMIRLAASAATLQLGLSVWDQSLAQVHSKFYPVMSIQVDPDLQSAGLLPKILRKAPPLEEQEALYIQNAVKEQKNLPQRSFALQMMGGGMMGMMGSQYRINGEAFDLGTINFSVAKGKFEIWRFQSDMQGHPVHIHGVQFRILQSVWEPNGSPDWHDTFTLGPDREAVVLVRFRDEADSRNPYMLHCHMLEHEEAGMMAQFTVR